MGGEPGENRDRPGKGAGCCCPWRGDNVCSRGVRGTLGGVERALCAMPQGVLSASEEAPEDTTAWSLVGAIFGILSWFWSQKKER